MYTLNRYEAIGIGGSVLIAVAVLAVVHINRSGWELPVTDPNLEADIVTVDATIADSEAALARAITEGSNSKGVVTKLIVQDMQVGTGRTVRVGDTVTLNYIGVIKNGAQFNSTYSTGIPYSFKVGASEVIEGWDKGIVGMQEGGKRILVIPSAMAYGNSSVGPIPPNATLIFALELLSIE